MRKRAALFFSLLLLTVHMLAGGAAAAAPAKDELVSGAVVLMDADTGEILYSKNPYKRMYPASITKILTAMIVLDTCDLSETMTASKTAVKLPKGYAHIGLAAGNRITVEDAMYAMMMPSANDAANVLAEHSAGSIKEFAALMNTYAESLGATDSNFTNPSGIPAKTHYTTAYDMALITREAIDSKTFLRFFGETEYTLPAFNKNTKETEIQNYQFMMREDEPEYNPLVIGGKIGYTKQAGHTMVTLAEQDGRRLICVVMGSDRDGKYQDTNRMIEYGFSEKPVARLW